MKTQLHINLHRQAQGLRGIVTITQKGKVVGYCDSATVIDCGVWEDAKKALFSRTEGNKRTVHIAVVGTLIDVQGFVSFKERGVDYTADTVTPPTRRSHYNPKRGDVGFMVDGEVWSGGEACTVSNEGMWVS